MSLGFVVSEFFYNLQKRQEPKEPIENSPGVGDYSQQRLTQCQQVKVELTAVWANQALRENRKLADLH